MHYSVFVSSIFLFVISIYGEDVLKIKTQLIDRWYQSFLFYFLDFKNPFESTSTVTSKNEIEINNSNNKESENANTSDEFKSKKFVFLILFE